MIRIGKVLGVGASRRFHDPFQEEPSGFPLESDQALDEGTWIEVEIASGQARWRRSLASPGSALDSVYQLAAHHGADPVLPPECESEAAAWLENPGIEDPELVDLTHLAFVTIDNPDSRDLDQALLVERVGEGHSVWYALADASYYVRPGSALFREALRRGATFYLPGLVATMLPRTLCEDLVSLNPLVDRRAMVLRMKIGAEGRCLGTEFLRARVRSRAKLSYQGVQAWLDGGQAPSQDPEVQTSLRELVTVGERRLHEAESRDVVRFRRQEVSVSVGGKGLSFVARVSPRNDVERYNEQISLLANIQAARWLRDAHGDPRVQPIFRTHEPPLDAALEAFSQQLEGLVQAHALDPSRWSWSPGGCESLAAFVRRLPLEEGPHQGVARAISREALRTGGRSGFSSTPSGHHGVGAEVYSRFTAPMREVVGIFVHKELWEHLEKQEANPSQEDERIREQIVSVSQAARRRQRALDQECNRLVLDQLFTSDMQQQPVPPRVATVMGVGRGKIHLQLQDPPIEIKAYRRDLERILGEQLHLEMGGAQVCGSDGTLLFRVGDPVRVQVRGLDPELDRWSLDVESVFEKE